MSAITKLEGKNHYAVPNKEIGLKSKSESFPSLYAALVLESSRKFLPYFGVVRFWQSDN